MTEVTLVTTAAGGLQLAGRTAGPDHAPRALIVALHGGTYSSKYYDLRGAPRSSALQNFARLGYRVLAVDRPGYGSTAGLAADRCSFDAQADTLARVIEAASVHHGRDLPVFLIGHSIGGMLALMIAAAGVDAPLTGVMASAAGPVYAPGVRENLASADGDEPTVVIPNEVRDALMFLPQHIEPAVHADARDDLHAIPKAELTGVLDWPDHMPAIGAKIPVPVLFVMPAGDGLWASDDDAQDRAAAALTGPGEASVVVQRNAGHCLDAHRNGYPHHLATAAFLEECMNRSRR